MVLHLTSKKVLYLSDQQKDPMRLNPSGTAINSTVQQVAGAIGTVVFVTVMTTYEKTRIT